MSQGWKRALWILGICGAIAFLIWNTSGSPFAPENQLPSLEREYYESDDRYGYEEEEYSIDFYDAISDYWDEIREYVSGTETVFACSDNGNCYDLDADISDGYIETVYFDNGGYLSVYAEIDSNGEAWDYAQDGREWSFTFDMDSSFVEDAVYEWADDNGYSVE